MTRRNTSTIFTGWTTVVAALKETTPCLLAVGIFLAVCGTASAETWTLSWNPAATYTDGTPITGKTIIYSVYWSTDPGTLSPMAQIATGVTQTSTTFDPAPQGMIPGRTVYFRMKTALNTGEVSDYSAALAWVVPGTTPPPTLVPGMPANLTIGMLTSSGQTIPGASSPAQGTWRLAWDPVSKYADGQGLQSGRTVRYDVYWTRDPSLAGDALIPLATSLTVPSAEFAPQAEGMENNERVYFAVTANLDTGEESALSGSLAWRVSNKGPAPPARGKILHK